MVLSKQATPALPRPSKHLAVLSLALMFLCGGVAGAVVMSYLVHPTLHRIAPGSAGMSMSIPEWKQQLDLSDEQIRQLTSILDDFSRYYDNLLADGNTRVLQILNPEQVRKYEEMIRKHKR